MVSCDNLSMEKIGRVRPSEIRSFLLRYAENNGIRVQEFVSDEVHRPIAFYCHLEIPATAKEKRKTATAISHEGHDTALAKAFLYLGNSALDFLE